MSNNRHRGTLFVVSAPSGAGKSTLVSALLAKDDSICLSVSYTTRAPRPGERDGREYHFVSVEEFQQRAARGEFLESAVVHDNLYGTSRVWIAERMAEGNDVLLEIDWQGARQVRERFPDSVGIFILPPSIDVLESRLRRRGQDSETTIVRRVEAAGSEIAHAPEFEYVIINQDFPAALEQVLLVIQAARLRFGVQAARHADLFTQLGLGFPD
jgi:guanylate kinase